MATVFLTLPKKALRCLAALTLSLALFISFTAPTHASVRFNARTQAHKFHPIVGTCFDICGNGQCTALWNWFPNWGWVPIYFACWP